MEASFQTRLRQLEDYYPLQVDYMESPYKRVSKRELASKAFDLAGELNKLRELKPYYKDMGSRRPRITERVEPIGVIEQEQKFIPFIEEPELEQKHDFPRSSGESDFSWRGLLEGDNLFNQPPVQIDDGVGIFSADWNRPISNIYLPTEDVSSIGAMLPY